LPPDEFVADARRECVPVDHSVLPRRHLEGVRDPPREQVRVEAGDDRPVTGRQIGRAVPIEERVDLLTVRHVQCAARDEGVHERPPGRDLGDRRLAVRRRDRRSPVGVVVGGTRELDRTPAGVFELDAAEFTEILSRVFDGDGRLPGVVEGVEQDRQPLAAHVDPAVRLGSGHGHSSSVKSYSCPAVRGIPA
jgi:hypothetical protein